MVSPTQLIQQLPFKVHNFPTYISYLYFVELPSPTWNFQMPYGKMLGALMLKFFLNQIFCNHKNINTATYSRGFVRILKQTDKVVIVGEKSSNKWNCKSIIRKKPLELKKNHKKTQTNPTILIMLMIINLLHLQCVSIPVYKNPNFG